MLGGERFSRDNVQMTPSKNQHNVRHHELHVVVSRVQALDIASTWSRLCIRAASDRRVSPTTSLKEESLRFRESPRIHTARSLHRLAPEST